MFGLLPWQDYCLFVLRPDLTLIKKKTPQSLVSVTFGFLLHQNLQCVYKLYSGEPYADF